jgi:hypothetical protein
MPARSPRIGSPACKELIPSDRHRPHSAFERTLQALLDLAKDEPTPIES